MRVDPVTFEVVNNARWRVAERIAVNTRRNLAIPTGD